MKIRIKANSVRLRLSKSDVEKLSLFGILEERTDFGRSTFIYSLQSKTDNDGLTADFKEGKISLFIPESFVKDWALNDVVGLESNVRLNDKEQLYLLVEKDFKCIEESAEDQSDNFDNPISSCKDSQS